MKRVLIATILALTMAVPAVMAQDNKDHFELGAFADYMRLNQGGNTGLWGLGGRIGFGLASHVDVEADMAYDFEQNVTTTGTSAFSTTFTQKNGVRLWHGLFGPMIWLGTEHVRVFAVAKGGFMNFNISGASATKAFPGAVGNFFSDNTDAAFYPGVGGELSVGPFGLRMDVGDFIYFGNRTFHNLNVQFGPSLHF